MAAYSRSRGLRRGRGGATEPMGTVTASTLGHNGGVDVGRARSVLGVTASASASELRAAYRAGVRKVHPDRSPAPDAHARTAALTEAYDLLVRLLAEPIPGADPSPAPHRSPDRSPPPTTAPTPDAATDATAGQPADSDLADGSLLIVAPADETFLVMVEAASDVGELAHVDEQLGLVELVVRPPGGPTCSVLITLQGRATHTEALCTMVSIEAAPTPPIGPVLDLLCEALEHHGPAEER